MRGELRLLHLRQLRRQPMRALLAVIAIAAGVTLSVAVLIAQSSLEHSFAAYSETIAGPAPLRVSSRIAHGAIDASTLDAIKQTEGVQQAIPLVLAVGQLRASDGSDHLVAIVGADCSAATLFAQAGCDPAALAARTDADAPFIGPGIRDLAGTTGLLRTDNGNRSLAGAPVVPSLSTLNRGLVIVYPLHVAQSLFGRPEGLDAVFVVPAPGTELPRLQSTLESAVGPANVVVPSTETSDSVQFISAQILPFLLLISLFGIAVGAQLVYNTMTLSLEERRRELAVSSALGSTPRTVLTGVLAEAAVLGALGGVLGVLLGVVVAGPFIGTLSLYAEQATGVHLQVHVTPALLATGLAMGILASMAAAVVPARRASRLDIAGELADHSRRHDVSARVSSRRAIVLSALTALGLVLAWIGARDGSLERWQPNVILVGIMLAFVCGFALPPALAPPVLRRLAKLPVLDRGPARVAMASLVSETRRTSAVLMAVGAAVGMSFTLGNVFPGMALGAKNMTRQTAYDRVMVTTLPPNNSSGIDAKIAPDVQQELAGLPGVAAIEHQYHANMDFPDVGSVGLTATDGMVSRFPVYQGVDGTEAFARGEVMLGPALARDLSLRPGDTITVPGRYGPRDLVVGGIWQAPDELGRSIAMPVPLFQQIAGVHPPDWVMLVPQAGVTPAELARTVRAANLADNLKIFDPAALEVEYTSNFKGFLTPFWLLARGLLAVAFVATVSTLLLSGVQRRREHGLLAAVGMGPGDLGRMVLVEAGIIGVLGTLLGAICGAVGLAAFSFASASLTGLAIPFQLSVGPLLLYGGIATACVVAGAAFPAWRTSRLNPVTALRYE